MSCKLLSSEPIPLCKASKTISRLADAGYVVSPVIRNYLNRTVEAFDSLVQFRKKSLKSATKDSEKKKKKWESFVKTEEKYSNIRVGKIYFEGFTEENKTTRTSNSDSREGNKKRKNESVEKSMRKKSRVET